MYRSLPTITAKQRTVRCTCRLKQTTLKQRMVEKKVISVPFAAFFCHKETLLRKMHGKHLSRLIGSAFVKLKTLVREVKN